MKAPTKTKDVDMSKLEVDTQAGGEGSDTQAGGEGSDTTTGGEGSDTTTGGEGSDTTAGGEGSALTAGAANSVETDGVRARRGLMPKQFIPDGDWINKNVVAGGKGTKATIGRFYGIITKTERKTNTLPNGEPSETIVCTGIINSESYITGEIAQGSSVYFPMAYAEKIEAVMKADPTIKVVEIDCDIGLEATGKTIPYEWVIVAYREGAEMAVLKRIKGTRQRPTNVLISAAGAPLQLTALAK